MKKVAFFTNFSNKLVSRKIKMLIGFALMMKSENSLI